MVVTPVLCPLEAQAKDIPCLKAAGMRSGYDEEL